MTTVAYSHKSKVMAADTQVSWNDTHKGRMGKLFKVQGYLVGFAGCPINGLEFVAWLEGWIGNNAVEGCAFSEPGELEALVVTPSGEAFHFDERCVSLKDPQPFIAIGTGALAAMAAMECGCEPFEAVRVACKYDLYSSEPIDTIQG